MDDIQRQIYNDLEQVFIEKIKSYGLNQRDSKAHAEYILDYGAYGIHDLAMDVNNIMENEYA